MSERQLTAAIKPWHENGATKTPEPSDQTARVAYCSRSRSPHTGGPKLQPLSGTGCADAAFYLHPWNEGDRNHRTAVGTRGFFQTIAPYPPGEERNVLHASAQSTGTQCVDQIKAILWAAWIGGALGFPDGAGGGQFSPRTVHAVVHRAGKEAGFPWPVYPQMLIASCARNMAKRGIETSSIQQFLGYTQPASAARYIDLEENVSSKLG